ncbi:MAG: 3-oxoacyl-[acyl-carrier-protein] reductase [Alphaproteobacteria bacterium]
MFDLTGKGALITGASGGIGSDIARALHGAGATVGLSGTRADALQALADEFGSRAHVLPANLSDAAAPDELMKQAEATLEGGVAILVNNAGLTRDMLSMRLSDEDWSRVIDVNLTATFRLTRAALRGMMRRRWGRIVNIASIVGTVGNAGQANYAASKAGMIGMTKSIAQEVAARGITANCVAPGFIDTAMTEKLNDDQRARLLGAVPAGRLGTGQDVAAGVLYLASEEASYVTGATLHINGGMAMI